MRQQIPSAVDDAMRLIKSICPGAAIEFRTNPIEGASLWYVSTPGLELADNGFLRSPPSNGEGPLKAVAVLCAALKDQSNTWKVGQRYLRWSGFMFVDVDRPRGQQ